MASVPEPGSVALLAAGAIALIGHRQALRQRDSTVVLDAIWRWLDTTPLQAVLPKSDFADAVPPASPVPSARAAAGVAESE